MCGNGGRCIVAFARSLGIVSDKAVFEAIDGLHEAQITEFGIKLKMIVPYGYYQPDEVDHWVHTGSPHYVAFREESIESIDVFSEGRTIRNKEPWKEEGTNVNFVNILPDGRLAVRTYERGVEDETLSCGTGVTAVVVVYTKKNPAAEQPVRIHTPGGELRIHVIENSAPWLEGPAVKVFEGEVEING